MFKDAILMSLSRIGNVARFVSHDPSLNIRNTTGAASASDLIEQVGRVNIRSFVPGDHQSKEFVYDIRSRDELEGHLSRLSSSGLYTIVNELIDTGDGGVSGVIQGDRVEFAPNDTPRCVEKPGTCALSWSLGRAVMEAVYDCALPTFDGRTEFSVHPEPCGTRNDRVIVWEHEADAPCLSAPNPVWPNRFSRHIGDKAFGLLVASLLGFRVPATQVIPRALPPFNFGEGGADLWVRTCPTEQQPGLYTTTRGWCDPFAIMAQEDPEGDQIAAVIVQRGVRSVYSGAAITAADLSVIVEGKAGAGDDFMLGKCPEMLPTKVEDAVRAMVEEIAQAIGGPCRLEWVYDGRDAWVVQLHSGASCSSADGVIVPGEASAWVRLDTSDLAVLRAELSALPAGSGAILEGAFGLTSHIADVVRKAGLPARRAA